MTRAGIAMHAAAVTFLVGVTVWGAFMYPSIPELIPTHWGASGVPDAFSPKSIWSVFGVLMIAGAIVTGILLLQRYLSGSAMLVPAERRAHNLLFSYMNAWLALLFGVIALASWYGTHLGPVFFVLAVMGGLPIMVIMGLHLPAIIRERKELAVPGDPSQDPKYWVWGGMFYSNPRDARVWVPKAPHMGVGMTVNVASPGGRLFVVLILVVLAGTIALPFLLP